MNAEALIGTVLGSCTLQRLIGQGGMGAVFLAQQSRPRRQVAVKVLLPMVPLSADQLVAFLERFRRETDAAASLEHPNIVPVHEYGEEHGIAYLVMPYINGGTLRDEMEREGPLPLAKVVNYLDQMASALDFAHSRGVIHRDIKPANILMTQQGRLLLTDFGLVKIVSADGHSPQVRLTGSGAPVGTPDYMAPEQVIGGEVDGRADLYSLGIILYQMITGTTPFQGETAMQIAAQQLQAPPPSPQMLCPELPLAAEQVILRALAKRPGDRYMCAKDLAEAFRMSLVGAGIPLGFTQDGPLGMAEMATGKFAARRSPTDPVPIVLPSPEKAVAEQEQNILPVGTLSLPVTTKTRLPAAGTRTTETMGTRGGLLSRTGKFPLRESVEASTVTTDTLKGDGGATTSAKHVAVSPMHARSQFSPAPPHTSPLEPQPIQMSPVRNTSGSLLTPGEQPRRTTVKLTSPAKVVQVPVAGHPGRYMTGLLPVAPAHEEVEKKKPNRALNLVAVLIGVVLVASSSLGIFWLLRSHGAPGSTGLPSAVPGTPNVQATAMAQATATALANILLIDPLDRNTQNWLTTPPDVYAFKDGAYHITDHGDNGRATVLQGHTFAGSLGFTLTVEEVKGDDTSANNSFGMIFRFNQQTKTGKTATMFYSFEVVNTKNGEYQFWKYDDSKGTNSPWTEIWHKPFGSEFHQGQGPQHSNIFKTFANGSKFTFIVNGKKIDTVQDNALSGGTVGMIVNLNGTEVAFKDLLLTKN